MINVRQTGPKLPVRLAIPMSGLPPQAVKLRSTLELFGAAPGVRTSEWFGQLAIGVQAS